MQNIHTAPAAQNQTVQSVETLTIPLGLVHRLQNAAYFYSLAFGRITKTFIPSIAAAANSGNGGQSEHMATSTVYNPD